MLEWVGTKSDIFYHKLRRYSSITHLVDASYSSIVAGSPSFPIVSSDVRSSSSTSGSLDFYCRHVSTEHFFLSIFELSSRRSDFNDISQSLTRSRVFCGEELKRISKYLHPFLVHYIKSLFIWKFSLYSPLFHQIKCALSHPATSHLSEITCSKPVKFRNSASRISSILLAIFDNLSCWVRALVLWYFYNQVAQSQIGNSKQFEAHLLL